VILPVDRVRPPRLLSRLTGLLTACLLACLGVCVGALPAQAAAGGLLTSDPQERSRLDSPPGAVTLAFDGVVDEKVAKVLVLDAKGDNVTAGPLIVENTNVTSQLQDGLPKGVYTVHYRVDGKGGEPRGGAFQFSYGSGSFSDPADKSWSGTAQEPQILRGDDPNGPERSDAPATESPGVEVTSSDKPERSTKAPPPPTSTDTDDPDPSSTDTEGSTDPSASQTASAVPSDSGTGRGFLIGGIVLLLAVGGAAYGWYRSTKKGTHS
jgi:methionine-rich copper-binding protein CopC